MRYGEQGLDDECLSPMLVRPRAVMPVHSGDALLVLEGDGLPPSKPLSEAVAKRTIAETLTANGASSERSVAKVRAYDMEGAESAETELAALAAPQLFLGGSIGSVGGGAGPAEAGDPEARLRHAVEQVLHASAAGDQGAEDPEVGSAGEGPMDARGASSWQQARSARLGVWLPRLASLCPEAQVSVYRRTIKPLSETERGAGLPPSEGGLASDELAARRLGTQAFLRGPAPVDVGKAVSNAAAARKEGLPAAAAGDGSPAAVGSEDAGTGLGGEYKPNGAGGKEDDGELGRAWQLVGVASMPLGPLVESAERAEVREQEEQEHERQQRMAMVPFVG